MKHTLKLLLILALLSLSSLISIAQDEEEELILDSLINIGENDEFTYLIGPEGMTLYSFALDDESCVDACLEAWPPLTVEDESALTKTEGVPGNLGIYERDGVNQVTYNGMPLYYFAGDEAIGDLNGDRANNVWFIVQPVNIYTGGNEELGKFLVGPEGMTLYISANDEPDISNCTAECVENWIPFTVENDAQLIHARDVSGILGLFERIDEGTLQVTYNELPLYYFAGDEAIGDANGNGVDNVWFVNPPETIILGGADADGLWLQTAYRRTLYASQNDEPGVSNCVDECTETWIPYTVNQGDTVYGLRLEGEVSLILRPDDSLQVTYNEMPLYTYVGDVNQGDFNGYGIDEVWFNIPPGMTRNRFMNLSTNPYGDDEEGGEGEG